MNRRQLIVLGAALPIADVPTSAQQEDPNGELVRQFLSMYDTGNWEAADGFMSQDFAPLYPLSNTLPGLDAWKQRRLSETFNSMWASMTTKPISVATSGEFVHVLSEIHVTKHGGGEGVVPWVFVLRVQDGLITGSAGALDQAYITEILTQ